MKVKSARGAGPGSSMLAGPHLVSSALLQHSHGGYLEGARAGILIHRKSGGGSETREEGLDSRETWRGESAGLVADWAGDWTGNALVLWIEGSGRRGLRESCVTGPLSWIKAGPAETIFLDQTQ